MLGGILSIFVIVIGWVVTFPAESVATKTKVLFPVNVLERVSEPEPFNVPSLVLAVTMISLFVGVDVEISLDIVIIGTTVSIVNFELSVLVEVFLAPSTSVMEIVAKPCCSPVAKTVYTQA